MPRTEQLVRSREVMEHSFNELGKLILLLVSWLRHYLAFTALNKFLRQHNPKHLKVAL